MSKTAMSVEGLQARGRLQWQMCRRLINTTGSRLCRGEKTAGPTESTQMQDCRVTRRCHGA